MSDDAELPTREELLKARADIREQIELVSNPIRPADRNPALIAKLRAMLDDINAAIADLENDPKS
jgi:hypothetical protein